jgi:gluconate:H+ symporter, GntP family
MSGISAPLIGLIIAVFLLIFLVLRTRVHALIAMIIAACVAGIVGGMSVNETIKSITTGFGSTLGSIGIVIGLGVMMGRILEVSGAAEQIANSCVRLLGKGREAIALAMTGYFVSIPIFVDSAFVILFPIVQALARRSRRPILTLGVALGGGLVVTHTTVPPTPGPLGAAGIFGVDIGAMMLSGMALAIPCVAAILAYAVWLGNRFPYGSASNDVEQNQIVMAEHNNQAARVLPGLTLSWLPIALPIFLIFLKAVFDLFPSAFDGSPTTVILRQIIDLLGSPVIALSISSIVAVYTLIPWMDRKESNARLEEGLQSAGIILLVTGAGGALGAVVRDSGAGTTLAAQVSNLPISPVMIPFFVATAVRLIQGSGTVACITSASITAPVIAAFPEINPLIAAQSAVMGALCFSYFNDSLFWVVNRMMGVTDVRLQMLVWSVPTTIAWGVGGVSVAIANLVFGSKGTLLDPLFPLAILAVIIIFLRKRRAIPAP